MGKREVITRFVILGALWIAATAVIGQAVGGVVGDVIEGVAVLLLLLVAWSAFTPNARLFGRVIGTGTSPSPKVAITFDDGPSIEHTPAVLDTLATAGARCSFFVLGRHVRAHPEVARRIVEEGLSVREVEALASAEVPEGDGPRPGRPRRADPELAHAHASSTLLRIATEAARRR
jgi:peptidoglycan/xylan/chitin deacetylase (PgdA/CDA1 family)